MKYFGQVGIFLNMPCWDMQNNHRHVSGAAQQRIMVFRCPVSMRILSVSNINGDMRHPAHVLHA